MELEGVVHNGVIVPDDATDQNSNADDENTLPQRPPFANQAGAPDEE